MKSYYQRLCGLVRKAVTEYDMLRDGDRVAVGVSGGKDSVTLALALNDVRGYMGIDFSIVAITLDYQFSGSPTDYSQLEELFASKGIEYVINRTDIGQIVFGSRDEKSPCSLCRNLRRGALHNTALACGCNKIALGHHLDDAIETFYMNLWNEGRIGIFSPVTYLSRKDVTVIRPLILAEERDIVHAVRETDVPVVPSGCPIDGDTNRQTMKQFVTDMCRKDPSFRKKSLNAFQKKDLDGWGPKKTERKKNSHKQER